VRLEDEEPVFLVRHHPIAAMTASVLETERLVLRGHQASDFDACAAMWADPEVTRHISGKPSTAGETWARLLRYAGHWALLGYGFWALEEKATGRFVGEVGFADHKRPIEPSLEGLPEIGWVLSPALHGRGYATESVRAAIAWGDANLESARTACMISPENASSMKVAAKCGYAEFARTTYHDKPTILFARSRQAPRPA
jgi:RimJ/RimL family protein N-acetyltransferase